MDVKVVLILAIIALSLLFANVTAEMSATPGLGEGAFFGTVPNSSARISLTVKEPSEEVEGVIEDG